MELLVYRLRTEGEERGGELVRERIYSVMGVGLRRKNTNGILLQQKSDRHGLARKTKSAASVSPRIVDRKRTRGTRKIYWKGNSP